MQTTEFNEIVDFFNENFSDFYIETFPFKEAFLYNPLDIKNYKTKIELNGGVSGVQIFRRQNGLKICEASFLNGVADGCHKYYNKHEEEVGEEYYKSGEVLMERIIK